MKFEISDYVRSFLTTKGNKVHALRLPETSDYASGVAQREHEGFPQKNRLFLMR